MNIVIAWYDDDLASRDAENFECLEDDGNQLNVACGAPAICDIAGDDDTVESFDTNG